MTTYENLLDGDLEQLELDIPLTEDEECELLSDYTDEEDDCGC